MKGVHRLECTLIDQHGHHVCMGDEVEVHLPYHSVPVGRYDDDESIEIAPKLVRGIIKLQLSRGLVLKITQVEYEDGYEEEEDDRPLHIGDVMAFKRFAWDWKVITPVDRIIERRKHDNTGSA